MQQAHQLLERMRLTKVPSEPYIEASTVDAVYKVSLTDNPCSPTTARKQAALVSCC